MSSQEQDALSHRESLQSLTTMISVSREVHGAYEAACAAAPSALPSSSVLPASAIHYLVASQDRHLYTQQRSACLNASCPPELLQAVCHLGLQLQHSFILVQARSLGLLL